MRVCFTLNGKEIDVVVRGTRLLLDLVRSLGATAPKEACGVGLCGACTVLVDDQPVSACLYLAGFLDGADVWTAEGLAERFPEVIEAFVNAEGMQCGVCTPGQVSSVCALKLQQPDASEEDIRVFLNGNLCRCTGYQTIIEAAKGALRDE